MQAMTDTQAPAADVIDTASPTITPMTVAADGVAADGVAANGVTPVGTDVEAIDSA